MFRETSPQLSLFDPCVMFPGVLPPDDWCFVYRDKIYPLIEENQFRHLYDEDWGSPNKSVKLQVSPDLYEHRPTDLERDSRSPAAAIGLDDCSSYSARYDSN